ncbi:related to triglyceride lipase-cholesterol esterase [Lecanosticta acicola]|uniref:Related to triglyceride lipase-cholesterol esterase n=1 Tax=Lecanosticta acicola TaxID=111012 RepID=A0AAI9EE36_9PEZI|nr:related to triglyceride lipase-cholesterol esterase [Lecanosticta acicola]
MAPVPFIGRLHIHEYLALGASFLLLFLEVFVRTVTLLLPSPVIRVLYHISRNAFNGLSSPYSRRARNRKKAVSSPIAQAHDFVELCELYGYYAEEHVVQTKDGYLLGVHRLAWRRGEEGQSVNAGPGSIEKKVVYLHHGLMMNSEVWVCITEKERCLPFMLVDQGYDVWLGNNRGNKYSKKCLHHGPTDHQFWNFSMDQFAFHDIPDSINYILSTTHQPSLSYIGFSQGTAQAFATLSIHPTLNSKVDVFVALAPAMAPPGLSSGIVSSLVKSNPEVLYLAFGRRAILGSTTMWQALLYPGIFSFVIDKSLSFLFGWRMANIAPHQKLAAYPHLYSFTSTKSVVHWFQIIRNGKFQMFDDEVTSPTSFSTASKYYKVAKFPTRNIKTPIVLVYGGSDSLVDIKLMLKELPRHTIAKCVPKYEHLDLLWANDVDKLVFPHVLEALESYSQPSQTKREALGWKPTMRLSRQIMYDSTDGATPNGSQPPGYSEDEQAGRYTATGVSLDYERPSTAEEQLDESDDDADWGDNDTADQPTLAPSPFAHSSRPPLSNTSSLTTGIPSSNAADRYRTQR